MPVTHELWLVALSVVVAVQGAFVGLTLAVQIGGAVGVRRRLLLAGAAVSLAVTIWSMHFVGMLAARLPVAVDYLVFPTLLSFLVCVLVVGIGVFAANAGPSTPMRLAASAVVMGSGIVSMHYIGMSALHASVQMIHAPALVAASAGVAIAASGLALWLARGGGTHLPLLLSATVLGIAISGMHYTAMAGVSIFPHPNHTSGAPVLSGDLLATVVAVVAFLVSGVFLLILVPDRSSGGESRQGAEADPPTDLQRTGVDAWEAMPALSANGQARAPAIETGRGGYAPLGGAGAPPRRAARHLPIERDGATHFVAVDEIVAIHANAHYTFIFDGSVKLFCPLPISDVEARLDAARFLRVHRSHIVNIDRIVGLKRAGDNGIVELAGSDRYAVPVARSRVGWLKTRMGSRLEQAPH